MTAPRLSEGGVACGTEATRFGPVAIVDASGAGGMGQPGVRVRQLALAGQPAIAFDSGAPVSEA